MVEVAARGRAAGAKCPDCGRFSDRVHDRYERRLKDLPLAEQRFVIRLEIRRFICGPADCPRRTFAEPFSRLAAPYARFTNRLNRALERVGRPAGLRRGTDDLVTQGHDIARSAVQHAACAGRRDGANVACCGTRAARGRPSCRSTACGAR
ncbi:transposase family protein [Streptomyces kebangsaanensis]|uniref:transposase family protein n=1 Tax=Streptomyces kebangsaanensis TaxID=864058 RepID=UPI001F47F546|nr:transposase family protein [Streptomyces kebangsaanensis]